MVGININSLTLAFKECFVALLMLNFKHIPKWSCMNAPFLLFFCLMIYKKFLCRFSIVKNSIWGVCSYVNAQCSGSRTIDAFVLFCNIFFPSYNFRSSARNACQMDCHCLCQGLICIYFHIVFFSVCFELILYAWIV